MKPTDVLSDAYRLLEQRKLSHSAADHRQSLREHSDMLKAAFADQMWLEVLNPGSADGWPNQRALAFAQSVLNKDHQPNKETS